MVHAHQDVASPDLRSRMVAGQLVARGIRDSAVLSAMLEVPREVFLAGRERSAAYQDAPQPVACGQTISQPFIVARMLELLGPEPRGTALEIGTGTGYQAALLGRLYRSVVSIERHASLAQTARENLTRLGVHNVCVITGDGTRGAPARAPFDAIIVAAAAPKLPRSLLAQLADGGRLICPVGNAELQHLLRVQRAPDGSFDEIEELDAVVFVPLIGHEGWPASPG